MKLLCSQLQLQRELHSFHRRTVDLYIIKVFYSPTNAQMIVLKKQY